MLIKEIKHITPAIGAFATYKDENGKIDKDITAPVIVWAICVCEDGGETFDAIMGFVSAAEEGLQPAEDVSNFLGYEMPVPMD